MRIIKRIKICKYCKEEFKPKKETQRFCSQKCVSKYALSRIDYKTRKARKGYSLSENHKNKIGEANKKNIKRLWGDEGYAKHMSEVHIGINEGEAHSNWKGDAVGYISLHSWVRRKLGKASQCEQCGEEEKRIHWSNIDHKYRRNIKDYRQLCSKCHRRYDIKEGILGGIKRKWN